MRTLLTCLIVPALCVAPFAPVAAAADPPVRLVSARDSRIAPQAAGSGFSLGVLLSRNGQFVLFTSSAPNLVRLDDNGARLDVFVRDRHASITRMISMRRDEEGSASGNSIGTWISPNGRWVAFESTARDLTATPVTGAGDVYLTDTQIFRTDRVSVNAAGTGGGNAASQSLVLTPDARFALFESAASDLVPGDDNEGVDIFVRDLQTGITHLVSIDAQGRGSGRGPSGITGISRNAAITPDGRYVVFESYATNLIVGDSTALVCKVFVRDLQLGVTSLVSVDTLGHPPLKGDSMLPVISDDGRYVAFLSNVTGLVPGVTDSDVAVYRRDLLRNDTIRISPSLGATSTEASQLDMSADGQVLAFSFRASSPERFEVQVWDSTSQVSRNAGVNSQGTPGDGMADSPWLSRDGRILGFLSDSSNLAPVPTHGVFQAYVRDLVAGTTTLASLAQGGAEGATSDCVELALSDDGTVAGFVGSDGGLVPQDANHEPDVFAHPLYPDAKTELVSRALADLAPASGNGASSLEHRGISQTGRFVLFNSLGDDLTVSDTNQAIDLFLRDTAAETNLVVSVSLEGDRTANRTSHDATMTRDGRFVAFFSRGDDLAPLDSNTVDDVYLRDTVQGTTALISVNSLGTAASGANATAAPAVSPDGRFVAFLSGARDLTSVAPRTLLDLYVRDRQTDTTVDVIHGLQASGLVGAVAFQPLGFAENRALDFLYRGTNVARYDIATQTAQTLGASTLRPAITPDGRYLALHWAIARTGGRISRLDTSTGLAETVAESPSATGLSGTHWNPAISDDGRFIAFVDSSGALSPADTNGVSDVYVGDLAHPGLVTLVSLNRSGTAAGNGASDDPTLSADGRFLAFRSAASDLVPGDNNGVPDIFVRDLRLGITYLASVSVAQTAANSRSAEPQISADGRFVAFTSFASDLIARDGNPMNDVFAYTIPQDGGGDTDGDGLADDWERTFFGTLEATADDDPDGDGLSNGAERLAGTVPTSAASALRLRTELLASEGVVRLGWPAVAGRAYGLQFKAALGDAEWQWIPAPPITATGGELQLIDLPNSPTARRFYRVVAGPGEP